MKIKNGDKASRIRHRNVLSNSNGKSVLNEIKPSDKSDESDQVSRKCIFSHLLIKRIKKTFCICLQFCNTYRFSIVGR